VTVVGSLEVLLPGLTSPPPDTVATLTTLAGAVGEMSAVYARVRLRDGEIRHQLLATAVPSVHAAMRAAMPRTIVCMTPSPFSR